MRSPPKPLRRAFLQRLPALAAALLGTRAAAAQSGATGGATSVATKPIPATGESIPVVGLGSWITFNVGNDPCRAGRLCRRDAGLLRRRRADDRFVADVRLVAGHHRPRPGATGRQGTGVRRRQGVDLVEPRRQRGPAQIEASRRRWGVPRFDLLQVHNLLDWEAHLPTLLAMKAAGHVRYVGITTSEGRRHREMEALHAQPAARLRAAHLQPARPRSRTAPAAAGAPSAASPSSPTGRSAKAHCCRHCSAIRCRHGRPANSAATAGRSSR